MNHPRCRRSGCISILSSLVALVAICTLAMSASTIMAAPPAAADTMMTNNNINNGTGPYNLPHTYTGYTVGTKFAINSGSMTVTHLGYWDWQGNGIPTGTGTVKLWAEGVPSSPLASVTVSGTTGDMVNGYRYIALGSPITIGVGTYRIASSSTITYNGDNSPTGNTYGGKVSFLGGVYTGSDGAYPGTGGIGTPTGYSGASVAGSFSLAILCPPTAFAPVGGDISPSATGTATATMAGATVTFSDSATSPNPAGEHVITRTWSAALTGQTTVTCTQSINVYDACTPGGFALMSDSFNRANGSTANNDNANGGILTASYNLGGFSSIQSNELRAQGGGINAAVWNHNLGAGSTGAAITGAGAAVIEFKMTPRRFTGFAIKQSNTTVAALTPTPADAMLRVDFGYTPSSGDPQGPGQYSVSSKGVLLTQASYLSGEQQPGYDPVQVANEYYNVKVTLKTTSFGAGQYADVWVEIEGDFDNDGDRESKLLDLNGQDPGNSVYRFTWTAANAAYLTFFGGGDSNGPSYDNLKISTDCSPVIPESNICPGVLLTDSFNRPNGLLGANDNLVDVTGDTIPDGQVGITYFYTYFPLIDGNTLFGPNDQQPFIVPENLAVGPGATAITGTGGFVIETDVTPWVGPGAQNTVFERWAAIVIDDHPAGISQSWQASIGAVTIYENGFYRFFRNSPNRDTPIGHGVIEAPANVTAGEFYHVKIKVETSSFGTGPAIVSAELTGNLNGVPNTTITLDLNGAAPGNSYTSTWSTADLAVVELHSFATPHRFDNLAISTLADTIPPVVTCNSMTVNIPAVAPNEVLVSGYDLANTSSDPFPNCLTVTSSQGTFTCDDVGANTVTVTVVDSNGNVSTCNATVTVTDTSSVCCTPTTEVCDGVDNDCDNLIDEDIAAVSSTCGTGKCASTGSITCVNGALVNSCVAGTPDLSDASCNNVDDDCDGSTDEDYQSVASSCGTGACASTGLTSCVGGVVQNNCTPGTPAANDATCNGIDDDCDGTADEEYASVATSCGIGACVSTGNTSCVGGAVTDSCTAGTPTSDANCDSIDNDCDGATDEHYVSLGTSCGIGACASTGSTSCVAGSVVDSCTAGTPTSDANCNGIDNDCDGITDEDYVSVATSCGVGECASAGATSCVAGVVQDSCNAASTNGNNCGDAGSECVNQDVCSNGTCQDNGFVAAGTACGDQSSNQCDAADTCNGAGACQSNNVANGTSCDDNNACTDGDSCQAGVCSAVPGLFAADSILWQAPLAQSPSNEDTDPSNVNPNDSKVGSLYRYSFKVGSTIPVKIRALGCTGADVTAYSNVQAHVAVFSDVNCDGVGETDLPENFTGVGGPGGLMVLTDGKLHFNLKTTGLTTSGGCLVLQVTVTDNATGDTTTEKVLLKAK